MTLPFIPIFLGNNTNLNPTEIGFIVGVSPLADICASFIGGYLSDKLGRKNILLVTIIVSTFVLISYFLITHIKNMQVKILSFTLLSILSFYGHREKVLEKIKI